MGTPDSLRSGRGYGARVRPTGWGWPSLATPGLRPPPAYPCTSKVAARSPLSR